MVLCHEYEKRKYLPARHEWLPWVVVAVALAENPVKYHIIGLTGFKTH